MGPTRPGNAGGARPAVAPSWHPFIGRRFGAPGGRALPLVVLLLAGCATVPTAQRAAGAKAMFDQTARQYHLPAATAQGAARDRLLEQAATGYRRLLRQYPDQADWAAMALRSLGNVRATQGRLDEAIKLYDQVGRRYPQQDWELIQAWKSAADLLREAGHDQAARGYYQRIVDRFGQDTQPAVIKLIVKAAQRQLSGPPGAG